MTVSSPHWSPQVRKGHIISGESTAAKKSLSINEVQSYVNKKNKPSSKTNHLFVEYSGSCKTLDNVSSAILIFISWNRSVVFLGVVPWEMTRTFDWRVNILFQSEWPHQWTDYSKRQRIRAGGFSFLLPHSPLVPPFPPPPQFPLATLLGLPNKTTSYAARLLIT